MSLRAAALHLALLAALWLAGILLYVVVFCRIEHPFWFAVDAAVLAGCVAVVGARWHELGIAVVTRRRFALLVVVALAAVLATQLAIPDRHQVWLDESQYLATMREGAIIRDGIAPFNVRWLVPFLAGPLNAIPVDDVEALAAINFGALVVTCVYLALLVLRLRVRFVLALLAPVFLLASYLGVYASTNRLVLDPFNYAMFVLVFHAVLRVEHVRVLAALLLVLAFNSEKVVYWIPIIALVEWLRSGSLRSALAYSMRTGVPVIVYAIVIAIVTRDATVEENPSFIQNLHLLAPTWIRVKLVEPTVVANSFQILWFPFGAFTIYALLALRALPRAIAAIALLVLPIYAQTLFAYDTQRMIAYAFIVYLPFGLWFLDRALAAMPRLLRAGFIALLPALAIAQYYAIPLGVPAPRLTKLVLATSEILIVGALLFLHLVIYRNPDRD